MGILMGALGGAGEALSADMRTSMAADVASDARIQQSGLDQQKIQALELFKQNLTNSNNDNLRDQQMDRIGDQAGELADTAITAKRGIINAGIASPNDWTDEQQAAVDQSLDADKDKLASDPKLRQQAATLTGDISPEKAATLGQSVELQQLKMDNYGNRTEMMQKLAEIRAQAMTDSAQLRVDAANQRATTGKIDTATGRMLITSEDANIKAATSQMNLLNKQLENTPKIMKGAPNQDYLDIKSQMDDLRSSIKSSQDNKVVYLKSMNLMGGAETSGASSKSSSGTPAGLPSGAIQIGTSGGKPVYQTPDGKQFQVQ